MRSDVENFLRPLRIDVPMVHRLSQELYKSFKKLATESKIQFLPTPITESILRPAAGCEKGRYLAIDIGGTNLRVGFIELLGHEKANGSNGVDRNPSKFGDEGEGMENVRRLLEKSWPILDHLKSEHEDDLFAWIGSCIAEVVRAGCQELGLPQDVPLPLGVTFSFPMIQQRLADAVLMPMGKGFTIRSHLHLGAHLSKGYAKARTPDLPSITIVAIANDAVSTLISFVYQTNETETRKAAMGLICGTGCNATILLDKNNLNHEKLPREVKESDAQVLSDDGKIAVNTEWTINGTAPALQSLGLVTKWDTQLDEEGEAPGFQPLEYMVAGRYLGELGRLMLLDYLTTRLGFTNGALPAQLSKRFGITTTFLSLLKPPDTQILLSKLMTEYPTAPDAPFQWTEEIARLVYDIVKAVEVRAAGIIAAATIGLLTFAGDIPLRSYPYHAENVRTLVDGQPAPPLELVVGYTGGCIVHFQDYLADCQDFLDRVIDAEFGNSAPVRVLLSPCHDGGIKGAGVLCGTSQAMLKKN
ncbi:hexokinase-7 [Pseudomassariella vexata]|uniref:Phosphotransferase n=1 Tax=Pseudomassariella vexata TaxID=1141098 RepID=A0A1Y2E2V9_9PEZI|nr:hexokinase-7 [Pseudomassariella vexata]ORY65205.1 hexokinase-7 [Pseudomassariella vexata]